MKKYPLIIPLLGTLLLCGCGTAVSETPSTQISTESTDAAFSQPVTEHSTTASSEQTETEDIMNSYETTWEELQIPNGTNTIYGKLYRPTADGKYPLVILSHGYNGSHSDFSQECQLFSKNGYLAFAYDFCGGSSHSQSTGDSTDMTIFTEESDLLAVLDYFSQMDNVDTENIFLMGGSQGGCVSTLAAKDRTSQIKAMVLYFPALCIPDNWQEKYSDTDEIPERIDFWGLTLGKNFVTSLEDFQIFDEIGNYTGDVLIMHGDKDAIVPLSYSERAVETYSNASLIVMEGEGHGFAPVAAKEARETALRFLMEHTN